MNSKFELTANKTLNFNHPWRVCSVRYFCGCPINTRRVIPNIIMFGTTSLFNIIAMKWPHTDTHAHTQTHTQTYISHAFDRHFAGFMRGGGLGGWVRIGWRRRMKWKCDTQTAKAGGWNFVKRIGLVIIGLRKLRGKARNVQSEFTVVWLPKKGISRRYTPNLNANFSNSLVKTDCNI